MNQIIRHNTIQEEIEGIYIVRLDGEDGMERDVCWPAGRYWVTDWMERN